MREQLIESGFPHHSGIQEDLIRRDRAPDAIDQPPSLKARKANRVPIKHGKFDLGRKALLKSLVLCGFFSRPGLSFSGWTNFRRRDQT